MKDKIHILGASGSGVSTLGHALSSVLPHVNFDGDDYFWYEKFTKQRERQERLQLLKDDLAKHNQWMADLQCPILRIEGSHTVKERLDIVLDYLNNKHK